MIKIIFYPSNFVPESLLQVSDKILNSSDLEASLTTSIFFIIFAIILLILIPISLFMMKKFKRFWRMIFLLITIISFPLIFLETFHLIDHVEYFFEASISLISGAILYSSYFVLDKEFR